MAGTSKNQRIAQIISILIKYGFEDFIANSRLKELVVSTPLLNKTVSEETLKYTRAQRIRLAAEELGPTFVKLAQIMANRPDMLPAEWLEELAKTQKESSPVPNWDVEKFISEELGRPFQEIFRYVNHQPMACGSIAQAHRAIHVDGTEMVLKLQRPDIATIIEADLEILHLIASQAESNIEKFATFQPVKLVESFQKHMLEELNFRNEVQNIKEFYHQYKGWDGLTSPRTYEYCSSGKIIAMEMMKGHKIDEWQPEDPSLKQQMIDTLIDAFFSQILEYGFFHADPHPGNILVQDNGEICFIDFGNMGRLTSSQRELLSRFFFQFLQKDYRQIARTVKEIAISHEITDMKIFESECEMVIQRFDRSLADIELKEMAQTFTSLIYKYRIELPQYLHSVFRAVLIMEGLGSNLDPDFEIFDKLRRFGKKIVLNHLDPKKIAKDSLSSLFTLGTLLKNVPHDLQDLIDTAKEGKFKIDIKHHGLEDFRQTIDSATNRISLAIITAAIIIGSSVIIFAQIPPLIYDIPILGFIGFFLSSILGFYMILTILRNQRPKK
ncbi:ABC1 kinase family protein [Persicobacter diffluens]|uniref:Ubiquinone biosynthesis protein UbiB n=1 Tax=Persicobacter diffluens TaxID=981 RepID=A0AAN4VX12_9BACT|nr:ubiquinone biosynthesis protein UbiB [Persicobacter diffluens]